MVIWQKLCGALLVMAAVGVGAQALSGEKAEEAKVYALVDIDGIGADRLADLEKDFKGSWWVEADRQLLVLASKAELAKVGRPYRTLAIKPELGKLFLVREANDLILKNLESHILLKGGRQAVVQAKTGYLASRLAHES